jgi:prepilin-type N-terminal cleavage/methylation domain-containing protein
MRVRGGFSLVEALVVMALVGVVLGISANTFRGMTNDLENAVAETAGFFRQTRVKAMATTSAYRVVVNSSTELAAEWAATCSDLTWTNDAALTLRLRDHTKLDGLTAGAIVTCFNSRGVASGNPKLTVHDRRGRKTEVEVFVGGGVRINRPAPGGSI